MAADEPANGTLNGGPKHDASATAAVDRFREYIRIRSVCGEGPNTGAYRRAVDFIAARCTEIGLQTKEVCPVANKPILIATWPGTDPSLPSILLNSHYDVVPVMQEHWCCDPFAADLRDGYVIAPSAGEADRSYVGKGGECIYGRGTQDMKSVTMQYLDAIERLIAKGFKPRRTCYVTVVPDEEIGGADGMAKFLYTEEFAALRPLALALDEGLANPRDAFTIFYGERIPWWLLIRAEGPTGHGSRFIQNTACEKLMGVVNKALQFRKEQEERLGYLHAGCKHSQAKKLGDVTTLNCTMLNGGVSVDGGKTYSLNVIPMEMQAGFDVRISPTLATAEFRAMLDEWCKEEGLSWKFAEWCGDPVKEHNLTCTDRSVSPFYGIFEDACKSTGHAVERDVFPAATDSRFLRLMGIQALGFSPMPKTPVLLHEHNEALSVDTFLNGIDVYCTLLEALLNTPQLPSEAAEAEPLSKKPRVESTA